MITEIAKSGLLRAASCTPTTFSTALPAIATITRPAKASLMCRVSIAGVRASTNQSEVNAAAAPLTASTVAVRPRRPADRLVLLAAGRLQEAGRVTTKTTSRTPAQMSDSVCSWGRAAVWSALVSDGIAIVAAASSARVDTVRARDELNC